MSNYTKTVDFAAKDALATGNAAKIVKGTEIDTEYNNIATSSATKLDITSSVGSTATSYTVTGSAIPVNGMYLPAANTVGLASNSILRTSVNSTGNWSFVAPSAGNTFAILSAAATNSTGVVMSGTTTGYNFLRITNTSGDVYIGPEQSTGAGLLAGTTNYAGCMFTVGATPLYLGSNSTARLGISTGGVVTNWEGSFNISAATLMQAATVESGSFTLTGVGFTAGVNGTANWVRSGTIICLTLPQLAGTSNATTFSATGLPAALAPARNLRVSAIIEDNGSFETGAVQLLAAGTTMTIIRENNTGTFTNSGAKALTICTLVYSTV